MKLKLTSIEFSSGLTGRILWIILSRLAIYGLLFATYLIFLPPYGLVYQLFIVYGILAIGFLIYVVILNYKPDDRLLKFIIGVQVLFEFAYEAILVNNVGGNFSPLLVLFILSIVSVTLVYGLIGTLLAATVAGLFYASPIIIDLSKLLPGIFETTQLHKMGFSSDEAFYTVFLHLCLFYLIAFISGYMAENLLFASKELHKIRLETDEILENMHSGMITVDNLGKIIYFNKAAGEILNVDSHLAKHTQFRSVLLKRLPELYFKIELALKTGYVESRGEIEIKIKNNTSPLGISTSVLRGEDNEIRGVIVVFQNLAEVKLMEKRLRDADRMAIIGQLSAGIAHEIRNPLTSISGSVEVLKDSLDLEDSQDKKLLDLIIRETARLNTILTDFLSFARITCVPGTRTNLIPVIDEVVLLAKSHPDFRDAVAIEYKHPDRPVYGRGSPDHYKQLLWNLILNSAQAIRVTTPDASKRGQITITCDRYIQPNGKVWTRLSIGDTGPGVPPNLRERIFNPFFSTKSDGTGLGLAIVSRIVESLEGKIEFDTGHDGTVFNIYLPPQAERVIVEKELEQVTGS